MKLLDVTHGVSRRDLSGHLLWLALWVGVTVVGAALTPSASLHGTHQQLGLPPCPSVLFFGRPCMGCGITTSFCATVHLDFMTAWAAHPFGPLLYLMFTVSALYCGWGIVKRVRFEAGTRAMQNALAVLTVAFVAFGLVRFATVKYPARDAFASLSAGEQRR